jgi:hypothetical protein
LENSRVDPVKEELAGVSVDDFGDADEVVNLLLDNVAFVWRSGVSELFRQLIDDGGVSAEFGGLLHVVGLVADALHDAGVMHSILNIEKCCGFEGVFVVHKATAEVFA